MNIIDRVVPTTRLDTCMHSPHTVRHTHLSHQRLTQAKCIKRTCNQVSVQLFLRGDYNIVYGRYTSKVEAPVLHTTLLSAVTPQVRYISTYLTTIYYFLYIIHV